MLWWRGAEGDGSGHLLIERELLVELRLRIAFVYEYKQKILEGNLILCHLS